MSPKFCINRTFSIEFKTVCGIAGFLDVSRQTSIDILNRMTAALVHRGPDDRGTQLFEEGIGLGHRRLSIIDLSELGHQPMSNHDGTIWITYNGEIYNYKELADTLKKKGVQFKSSTDTEVLIHLYELEGMKFVDKLIGMFAFALYDKKKKKLYLVRDRIGVKPLYIYNNKGLALFGSELKALAEHPAFDREIDHESIYYYLLHGYIPAWKTIYKHCKKLLPGHYSEVDTLGNIKTVKYWSVLNSSNHHISIDNIEQNLESLLVDSFSYRLVSDVPVGIFLSGGIDSTCVAALLTKVKGIRPRTFTIGFEDPEINEAPWALEIAKYLGTDHTEHYVSEEEALRITPDIPYIYDEPFGDSSAIPTYIVSKISRQYVKVILSADGGDELFCGYDRYVKMANLGRSTSRITLPIRLLCADLIESLPEEVFDLTVRAIGYVFPRVKVRKNKKARLVQMLRSIDLSNTYLSMITEWPDSEAARMMPGNWPPDSTYIPKMNQNVSPIDRLMNIDLHTYLPDDILVKVDRATMAVSLEGREPFLDHRLVEFAQKIPLGMKLKNETTKHVLRSILYKYVPRHMLERPKQGFAIPYKRWFQTALRSNVEQAINDLSSWKIFNGSVLKEILQGPFDRHQLWLLYSLSLWKNKWLK